MSSARAIPEAAAAFSAHAPQYPALRRRLVPGFDAFYGTLVDAVALRFAPDAPLRVLDLGAGTGLVSAAVAEAFPQARFELVDAAEPMLAEARTTLGGRVDAVHVADLAGDALPDGPFDAVVSALAIHHLDDEHKRGLFARVRGVLTAGGVFVNAEQLSGPTDELSAAYDARWAADCQALGASEAEITDALERMELDRCAPMSDQLEWLREAGFQPVDCLYRAWRLAVYAGFA